MPKRKRKLKNQNHNREKKGDGMSLDDTLEDDSLNHCEVLYQHKSINSLQILRKIFFPSYYALYCQLPPAFRLIVDYMELFEEDEHKVGRALQVRPSKIKKYHHAWLVHLQNSGAFSVMQQEYHGQIEYLRKKSPKKEDWN